MFSLSEIGQSNLHGLKANSSVLPYPLPWNTIDDLDEYDIIDETDALTFYGTAMMTVKAIRDSGTDVKKLIRACVSEVEVDGVTDPR